MRNYSNDFTDYLENIIYNRYRLLHEADDENKGEDIEIPPAPEAPDVPDDDTTPPAPEAPDVPDDDTTPPAPDDDTTPPAPEGDTTPPAPEAPDVPDDDTTPPAPEGDTTPPAPEGDTTPPAPEAPDVPDDAPQGEDIEIPDDPSNSTDTSTDDTNKSDDTENDQNKDDQNSDNNEKKDTEEDNKKKASEEALYKTLTSEQKKVREYKLKTDYRTLYDTIVTTIDGINDIPKTTENISTLQRLLELLSKIKQILIGYMDYNFDSNSYIENYSMYLRYVAVFRTVSKVINELNANKLKEKTY